MHATPQAHWSMHAYGCRALGKVLLAAHIFDVLLD